MSDLTKPLPLVVTGLIENRREIAGRIEGLKRQLKIAVCDLGHIEAALRNFKPDVDLSEHGPRPVPPPHSAFRGEVTRILMDALRTAKGPMNTRDLTEVLMRERGLPWDDLKTRQTMIRRVGARLNHWKRVKKILRSSPGPGQMLNWQVVDE